MGFWKIYAFNQNIQPSNIKAVNSDVFLDTEGLTYIIGLFEAPCTCTRTFPLPCLQVPGDINDVRPKFYLPRKDGDKSYLVPANLGIPGNKVGQNYQAVQLELNQVQYL